MTEESLGERIRKARLQCKLSQEQLAEKLQIAPRTVIRWEIKGERPNQRNQEQLMLMLSLTEEDFQRPSRSLPDGEPASETPRLVRSEATQELRSTGIEPFITILELEQMLPSKENFKIYRGRRIRSRIERVYGTKTYVTVNDQLLSYFSPYKLNPANGTVFEWGYGGAGPIALAQSLLADYLGEHYPDNGYLSIYESNALLYGSLFKDEVILHLPRHVDQSVGDKWEITSPEIRQWFYSLEAEGITRTRLLRNLYVEEAFKKST